MRKSRKPKVQAVNKRKNAPHVVTIPKPKVKKAWRRKPLSRNPRLKHLVLNPGRPWSASLNPWQKPQSKNSRRKPRSLNPKRRPRSLNP